MSATSTQPTTATPNRRSADWLAQVRARFSGSAVQQFLAWWGGELLGMLPSAWRALLTRARARVLFVPVADGIELRYEEGGTPHAVAVLPLPASGEQAAIAVPAPGARVDALLGPDRKDRARWLQLPAGQVLCRRIGLPAAASERLRTVVLHEIDRQTPFRADQVSFDCRVVAVDQATHVAQVDLLVLPRDRLDAALAALGPLAAGLSGVDALAADGTSLRCNLLPVERRKPTDRRNLWIDLALATVAFLALGFALVHALDNRRAQIDRLQTQVDALRRQARQVTALDKQLDAALTGANFLATHRAAQPPMLAVLADVSQRIPDNTFLERFSQQDSQIYLTGLSTDAASLVAKLQDSPLLRAPALTGSVQPDAAAKRDRFTLVATLQAARADQSAADKGKAAAASGSGGTRAASR